MEKGLGNSKPGNYGGFCPGCSCVAPRTMPACQDLQLGGLVAALNGFGASTARVDADGALGAAPPPGGAMAATEGPSLLG